MATGDPVVREYRRRAGECRAQAEKADEDEKGKWLKLAAKWEEFADAERRNSRAPNRGEEQPS
jgi:hypothetical protein